jgi:integrase
MAKKNQNKSASPLAGHAKYPMREQAEKYIAARANRGKSKASGAILRSDRTVQRYQGDLGRAAEMIQMAHGVSKLKNITQEQAQAYIDARLKEKIRIRTVHGYTKALELLPLVEKVVVPSRSTDAQDKPKRTRAYTTEQINEIQKRISSIAGQLAIKVIVESGCRAQDLASMRLESDRSLKNARLNQLHPDRFSGREDWIKVTFIGKGGHEYASTISPQTAIEIEKFHLLTPRDFRERGQENVVTQQCYDLPAGKRLSLLWTQASKQTFGFSRGIHGLRHTFAQERIKVMQELGMTWQKALECVSQQMGHYRADQVLTYCR